MSVHTDDIEDIDLDMEANELSSQANKQREKLVDAMSSIGKTLEKISEAEASKEYYDKGFTDTIKETLLKVAEILSDKKPIDLTPIINKVSEQNRNILGLIQGLSKESVVVDNSKIGDALGQVIGMIERNNTYLQKGIEPIDISPLVQAIEKNKPAEEWEFTINRDRMTGKQSTITAKRIK